MNKTRLSTQHLFSCLLRDRRSSVALNDAESVAGSHAVEGVAIASTTQVLELLAEPGIKRVVETCLGNSCETTVSWIHRKFAN